MPSNLLGIDNINVYANKALKRLTAEAPLLTSFTTDFSTLVESGGRNAIVPIFTSAYTLNDTDASGVVAQNSTSSISTVTLNTKDVTLDFSMTKWSSMSEETIANSLIPDMVQNVANLVAKDVFSAITYAAVGTGSVVAAGAFSGSAANKQAQLLSTAKAPAQGRTLIVLPTYFETLSNSAQGTFTNVANEAITNYRIGKGYGFENIIEWADLPNNSENLAGVAMHKSGIAFAMRPLPVFPGDIAATAVDPTSQMSFQVLNWKDMGKVYLGVFISYGYAIGNAGAIKAIRSA